MNDLLPDSLKTGIMFEHPVSEGESSDSLVTSRISEECSDLSGDSSESSCHVDKNARNLLKTQLENMQ